MKPNFALSLSFEGIGLLHRAGDAGWHLVGEVALDAADLAGELAALRARAAEIDASGLASKLILPEEQIKYLDLAAEDAPAGDIGALVANALDGATPYALEELAFDWVLTDGRVQVAAVARETLEEALAFAREHRFNPVSFVARPDPARFSAEPFFGPAAGAGEIERDTSPVRILGRAPAPAIPSATRTEAPAPDVGAAPGPAAEADSAAETAPDSAAPLPAFSSIRAERGSPESRSAPRLEGVARFAPSEPEQPSPAVAAPLRAPAETAQAARAAASLVPERAAAPRSAVEEARRMTVFGARAAEREPGKPRYLALILTAILLFFLIAVAAWAAIFTDSGLARLFRPPAPQVAVTPDIPDPAPALPPAAEVPGGAPVAVPSDPDAITPDEPAPPDVSEELTPAEALARYAATGIWQVAPESPAVPESAGLDDFYLTSVDEAVRFHDAVALPDAGDLQADARPVTPALPLPPGTAFERDARGLVLATPEGALTPDGLRVHAGPPPLRPPRFPERAATASGTEPAAEDQAERLRLAGLRPRSRPGDLIEQRERGTLAGLTRSELAALRPRPRPQAVEQAAAAAEAATVDSQAVAAAVAEVVDSAAAAAATPQAVAASLKPKPRPGRVETRAAAKPAPRAAPGGGADEIAEDDEPEVVATAASAPRIPTTASVARAATDANAINLREVNLIGVYGTPGNRRALVRLANGRYQKVQVGDRIDGGRVSAIGDSELRYNRRGRDVVLRLPKG